ncbi:hypothetical protein [Sphingomonas arenae]|uniref:hypothetical protein n=1 Tax=Sphingomonas arenae TaxID=2812555 RepID=UPI00196754E5|nr:hypothetical protein [Sphingomonas arenae]
MTRLVSLLLQVALVLSVLNAILFAVRIAIQQGLGVGTWYWAGAIAVFTAPAALALALLLFDRVYGAGALRSHDA